MIMEIKRGPTLALRVMMPALGVATASAMICLGACKSAAKIENPYLSGPQQALLAKLQDQSETPIAFTVWPAAGTVSSLQLKVPLVSAAASSVTDQAKQFVMANQGLWKISTPEQLAIGPVFVGEGCTTVTLNVKHPTGPAIYNATISVGIGPHATVQMVSARASGEPFSVAMPETPVTAAQARANLLKQLAAPGLKLPDPTEIIVDPYFLSNARHAAAKGWLFQAPRQSDHPAVSTVSADGPGAQSYSGPFIVSQATGQIIVAGPSSQPAVAGTVFSGCPSGENGTLPEVVIDALSGSPSYVGLVGVPGVLTSGTSDVDRAYSVFASPLILAMYGDLDPRSHLQNPIVRHRSDGGVSVQFQEFSDSLPVEGGALNVNLDAKGAAASIIGRVIYRPIIVSTSAISEATAINAAFEAYLTLECGSNRACRASLSDKGRPIYSAASLVILSSRLFRNTLIPAGQERLAWKIAFARRVLYWSADGTNQNLFSYPTLFTHIPMQILDDSRSDAVEFSNVPAIPVAVTPIEADGAAIAGFMPSINAFYSGVGLAHSFDNKDTSTLCVLAADSAFAGNAAWGPPGVVQSCPGTKSGIQVGPKMAVNDVVGHEFTHAVTFFTANLINAGESGALNESYSDIMAELIFPDVPGACGSSASASSWLLGECTPAGVLRDMKNPLTHGQPDNVGSEQDLCRDPSTFTHQCNSISNLAAVRASDGGIPGDPAAGIGRTKLKFLYFSTLTGGIAPASPVVTGLIASAMFVDQRVTTLNNCWSMVAVGPLSDGTRFTPDDCFHVADSFDSVGVTVTPQYGWTRFGTDLAGLSGNFVAYAGLHLFNGCTISDVTIRGVDPSTATKSSNIAGGLSINMGGWAANVTSRGSSTDPTDRQVNYHIGASWSNSGTVFIDESYNMPPGITSKEQCENPLPANQIRTLFSKTLIGHWASFLNGGRDDDTVNGGVSMPAACVLQSVSGIQYDKSGTALPPAAATMNNGGSGYTITSTATAPNGLDVKVHTWHDGVSGVFVRAIYNVSQPSGTDCSVAGATQNTE